MPNNRGGDPPQFPLHDHYKPSPLDQKALRLSANSEEINERSALSDEGRWRPATATVDGGCAPTVLCPDQG